MTFAEVFDEYQASRSISERTRQNERYAFSHLASLKNQPVQKISSTEVARVLRGMRGSHSEWTRHGVHRVLAGTFALALRRGIISRDPMTGLAPSERPKQGNAKRVAVLDAVAIDCLVAAGRTKRDRAALGLAGYAGLRLGELRGLRWEDVDFGASLIRVRRSLLEDGTPTKPKTSAGLRAVPLLPKLRRLLVAWKLRSPHARPPDLVICTAEGGHVLKGNLRRSLEAAKTKAKLCGGEDRLSWHSLRHSFASRLATDLELPATTLAEIIGHSDPGFTFRVYARDGRDEAAVVSDVLERAPRLTRG
jgi:integrase